MINYEYFMALGVWIKGKGMILRRRNAITDKVFIRKFVSPDEHYLILFL
jgi:hypothetical protein